jgi:transcription elongation factor GreA
LDVVNIGNTVTIQEVGYPEETYFVVGPNEANPQKGRISHLSPIGKAIIGRSSGEEVAVETPDGEITFKILKIE